MSSAGLSEPLGPLFLGEMRKTLAFVRRDFLVAWSYRVAFISDWLNLFLQIILFYFVGKMIDPASLPAFDGEPVSYVEFVAVGIAVASFLQIGLSRVVTVMRDEQLMGTLESVLLTPTAPTTMQLGSVTYDLLYVPLRMVIFLTLAAVFLGAQFDVSGIGPTTVVLLAFVPVVWGIGMASAAGVVVFRRGLGVVGLLTIVLTATSSAYFPIDLFPGWVQTLAQLNPVTVTLEAAREALLGGAGWDPVPSALAILVPAAAVAIGAGVFAFRLALRRERQKGTLGLY
jgi:ABC-type multidrug transport system permease subunit